MLPDVRAACGRLLPRTFFDMSYLSMFKACSQVRCASFFVRKFCTKPFRTVFFLAALNSQPTVCYLQQTSILKQ